MKILNLVLTHMCTMSCTPTCIPEHGATHTCPYMYKCNMHIHTRTRTCTHTHIGNPGRPLQTFGASRARRLMKASVTKIAIYEKIIIGNKYKIRYQLFSFINPKIK